MSKREIMKAITLKGQSETAAKPHFRSYLGYLALFLCAFTTVHAHTRALSEPGFRNLLDAVVRIDVWEAVYPNGRKQVNRGVGSGVLMREDGYILTNAHVVTPYAERISVTLANSENVPAKLIGWDHWTDLAVIQLDMDAVKRRKLTFSTASFGDSSMLELDQAVRAVGTPYGLTRTVTQGVISNTDRYFEGQLLRGYETGFFNNWLQTDAAINPGNSGGPLVASNGAVVGINSRSYLGANNLAFAVPSHVAEIVMKELIEKGKVVRSYVGITFAPLQDLETFYKIENNKGLLIGSVDPGSPAAKAGLLPGEIVFTLNGKEVDGRFPEQIPPIQHAIAQAPVGSTLELTVKRGDKEVPVKLTTELLESRVGEETAFEKWGLSVQKLTRSVARENQLDSSDGVIVIGVQSAFPAEIAGLSQGDVITKVNNKPLASLDQLKEAYAAFDKTPDNVLVEVLRNHHVKYFVIKQ